MNQKILKFAIGKAIENGIKKENIIKIGTIKNTSDFYNTDLKFTKELLSRENVKSYFVKRLCLNFNSASINCPVVILYK